MQRFIRRMITCVLAICMIFPSFIPVSAAQFVDSQNHWAQQIIEKWSQRGIVQGDEKGFRPDDHITRAEFATVLNNVMRYVETAGNKFSDLQESQWFYDSIIKLSSAGVILGSNGKAMPNHDITREEAAVMIARAFQIEEKSGATSFVDDNDMAIWSKNYIKSLSDKRILNGMPDGTFRPAEKLTRAETVAIFNNLISDIVAHSGIYEKNIAGNLLVNAPDVKLQDMTISGDLYLTQGVGEGEVTLDNVTISGNVYVNGGGENSIIFNNVNVKGALVVNKHNDRIRILATGTTYVSLAILESGALLMTRELEGGGFETIEISASIVGKAEIVLDGVFNKLTNHSDSAAITLNGSLKELDARVDTEITGKSVIDTIKKADGIAVKVDADTREDSSSESSNGSSGGGGDTGGSEPNHVSVTGISISDKDIVLVVGETKQLTAIVAPNNASNKAVVWASSEPHVATIDVQGRINAVSHGTTVITASTRDGNYMASTNVTVKNDTLYFEINKVTPNILSNINSYSDVILANNENILLSAVEPVLGSLDTYNFTVTATDSMNDTGNGRYLDILVTTKDTVGNIVRATPSVTVTQNVYENLTEQTSLLLEPDAGSYIFRLNAGGATEQVQNFEVQFSKTGFENTTLAFQYYPRNTVTFETFSDITGDLVVGSTVTAGNVTFTDVTDFIPSDFQWYRSDQENGKYSMIQGATHSTYTLSDNDAGKYLKVIVKGDEQRVYGAITSKAFGPVNIPIKADDVFAAINNVYLGNNSNAQNITGNLNLISNLSEFPGVVISWETNNPNVITSSGTVTQSEENDDLVELTAKLSGAANSSKTFKLIVRAKSSGNTEISNFVDPYFVEGYPRAYFEDGQLYVEYMLNKDATVYGVINRYSRYSFSHEPDVQAVLEGRSGKGKEQIMYVDEWPYFEFKANKINKVVTNVNSNNIGRGEIRLDFVVVDGDYVSEDVTEIHFTKEIMQALDQSPPKPYGTNGNNYAFLSLDKSKIYIYFNELLDLERAKNLTVNDFHLSEGVITSVIAENRNADSYFDPSRIVLQVQGITSGAEDISVTYIGGRNICDISDFKNETLSFSIPQGRIIHATPSIGKVHISSNRKHIDMEIIGGVPHDPRVSFMGDVSRYRVVIANGSEISPKELTLRGNRSGVRVSFATMNFAEPLSNIQGIKFNAEDIIGYADERFPEELVSTDIIQLPGIDELSAIYQNGNIEIVFPENYQGYGEYAGDFVITVDGTSLKLRGFPLRWSSGNNLRINLNGKYETRYKDAIEAGSNVSISYMPTRSESRGIGRFSDITGASIEAFGPITVVKK